MSVPFYVSPEQLMQDKAEYARKGIARGKSIVTLEFEGGIILMAENPRSLYKIGEVYDRIAFAGVGKFSEFDQLRKLGIRYCDVKGYAYSREDVQGKALANSYSQAMGDVFTREHKPLEVEIIVAEVGDDRLEGHERSTLYKVQFDGSISDHQGFAVIGGAVDDLLEHLEPAYKDGMPLGDAMRLGRSALERATDGEPRLAVEHLEVGVLDRQRTGRKFCRLSAEEVRGILES